MRNALLLLIVAVFACYAAFNPYPKFQTEMMRRQMFEEWIIKHNKVYASSEEKLVRYTNFLASLERFSQLNEKSRSMGSSATYGLTKFSDMTPEEFKSTILMAPRNAPELDKSFKTVNPNPSAAAPPPAFDWRTHGAVTPVKDQGQCGSCWAFSATETIESSWILSHNLTSGNMPPLSPQQIVSCDTSDDGCGGGDTTTAYQYVMSAGGLDTNQQYPYTAEDGTCTPVKPFYAHVTNWNYATTDKDENQMKTVLLQQGPISICLDAANWQDYQSGVMTAWQCAWINILDHCVQAVGYDMTYSTPYWIVRNSWGTGWGINGYIWLQYGANTCGLAIEPTYVITPRGK